MKPKKSINDKRKALELYIKRRALEDLVNTETQDKKTDLQEINKEKKLNLPEPVAITGLHGYFPACMDIDDFWSHLDHDRSLITEIPESRFKWQDFYTENGQQAGKMRSKWGGFIPDVKGFDPLFFNISPQEAKFIDPQQRLLLMSVWKTIEDAGYSAGSLKGSRTGVFVGVEENEYLRNLQDLQLDLSANAFNHHPSMIANRISYFFDLAGPSEMVNTMCSGAAVAMHRAIACIQRGEIATALVGAARIILRPEGQIALSHMNMLSTSNAVKSFGKDANGYVRAEGVASIWLKPLSAAKKDGDHIYAIIKNTAVNYNGQGGMSIAAPNKKAHTALIKQCYREAGIDPRRVSYIEAQGMGNQAGDIVEWEACNKALDELCKENELDYTPGFCKISTLKPMLGHMECTSAMGALFKIIHSFKTGKIHKILNFRESNPYIILKDMPCKLMTETTTWAPEKTPRYAGLHSYGSGGNNAHLLIEEYVDKFSPDSYRDRNSAFGIINSPVIIPLSAKSKDRLKKTAENLLDFLLKKASENSVSAGEERHHLENIAYTLQLGREAMTERAAFVVTSKKELIDKLTLFTHTTSGKALQEQFIFTGNAKAQPSKNVNGSIHDKSGHSLNALASLWVKGAKIAWEQFYVGRTTQRVSLPTYPFSMKAYWVAIDMESVLKKKADAEILKEKTEKRHAVFTSRNALEKEIKKSISKLLNIPQDDLDSNEDLMNYGFHSLTGIQLINLLREQYSIKMGVSDLLELHTITDLTAFLERTYFNATALSNKNTRHSHVKNRLAIKLNSIDATKQNVFLIAPLIGTPVIFRSLAKNFLHNFNCYGLQHKGFDDDRKFDSGIRAMAKTFKKEMLNIQRQGVFRVLGYSMGGTIGFELVKELEKAGYKASFICLDQSPDHVIFEQIDNNFSDPQINNYLKTLGFIDEEKIRSLAHHNRNILKAYEMKGKMQADMLALEASGNPLSTKMKAWKPYTAGNFKHSMISGNHFEVLEEAHLPDLSKKLLQYLK